jgi:hypothetical protein
MALCHLQDTYVKQNNTQRLKIKELKKYTQVPTKKKADVPILMPDKTKLKARNIQKEKEYLIDNRYKPQQRCNCNEPLQHKFNTEIS